METLTLKPRIVPSIIAHETSALLRLPAELRNKIYEQLLMQSSDPFHLEEGRMEHPILRVCKQIRAECTGVFYANTIFHFSDPEVCVRRLVTIPQKLVDLILELRYDTSQTCLRAASWRMAFRELPGLDEDTKLEALREELRKRGIILKPEVLKARLVTGTKTVWTSDPLTAAHEAARQGI